MTTLLFGWDARGGELPRTPSSRSSDLSYAFDNSKISGPLSLNLALKAKQLAILRLCIDVSVASVLTKNDQYFAELFDPDLAVEGAKTMEDLRKARRIAHAFRFICPSYYIPGEQDWGVF